MPVLAHQETYSLMKAISRCSDKALPADACGSLKNTGRRAQCNIPESV
jgi:hypothetical protein